MNQEIKQKAEYCLHCVHKPCMQACPLHNNIPEFIEQIKNNNIEEAYNVLSETTIFEPICGRICPHQFQCEGNCVRGIKGESIHIGELEAYVGDWMLEQGGADCIRTTTRKKIAIIGSGPAGIACAYTLAQKGCKVTIYEKHEKVGGLLRHGIPEFRLPREILEKWLDKVVFSQGIKVKTNKELGKNITIGELKAKYDAIVMSVGANVSNKMNIPGEGDNNVLGANELLEYKEFPNFKNTKVGIIGGGNVAIDAARTIQRQGANEVTIIYRRSEEEMPATRKEIDEAKTEGVEFLFQTNVLKIIANNDAKTDENDVWNNACFQGGCNPPLQLLQIECVQTELIQKEGEARKYPINIEGSNYLLDLDYVVMAIGAHPNQALIEKLPIETTPRGYIKVDENYRTSDKKIYAIGDLIGTKATVAWAAKSGFECAKKILE